MTTDNMVPVLCTLARHHTGDHDEHSALRVRKPCGAVVRYVERVAEEVTPEVDVGPRDGFFGAPIDPNAEKDGHNHFGEIFMPGSCPACAAMAKESPPAEPIPPPTAPTPILAKPGTPEEHVQRVAERVTEDAMKMTVPSEPPPLAELIEAVATCEEWVQTAAAERERAIGEHCKALASLDRRRSALALRAGKGALVMVGSVLFRSVPPRKPKGGEVAADALWRLEPVEVAK